MIINPGAKELTEHETVRKRRLDEIDAIISGAVQLDRSVGGEATTVSGA